MNLIFVLSQPSFWFKLQRFFKVLFRTRCAVFLKEHKGLQKYKAHCGSYQTNKAPKFSSSSGEWLLKSFPLGVKKSLSHTQISLLQGRAYTTSIPSMREPPPPAPIPLLSPCLSDQSCIFQFIKDKIVNSFTSRTMALIFFETLRL